MRWSFDGPAGSGFSDHFPVFAKFVVVPDGRTDRYISLRNASAERPDRETQTKIDYAKVDLEKVALLPSQLPDANIRPSGLNARLTTALA